MPRTARTEFATTTLLPFNPFQTQTAGDFNVIRVNEPGHNRTMGNTYRFYGAPTMYAPGTGSTTNPVAQYADPPNFDGIQGSNIAKAAGLCYFSIWYYSCSNIKFLSVYSRFEYCYNWISTRRRWHGQYWTCYYTSIMAQFTYATLTTAILNFTETDTSVLSSTITDQLIGNAEERIFRDVNIDAYRLLLSSNMLLHGSSNL